MCHNVYSLIWFVYRQFYGECGPGPERQFTISSIILTESPSEHIDKLATAGKSTSWYNIWRTSEMEKKCEILKGEFKMYLRNLYTRFIVYMCVFHADQTVMAILQNRGVFFLRIIMPCEHSKQMRPCIPGSKSRPNLAISSYLRSFIIRY